MLSNIVTISKARIDGQCIATLREEMKEVDKKIMASLGIIDIYNKLEREKTNIRKLISEREGLKKRVAELEASVLDKQ